MLNLRVLKKIRTSRLGENGQALIQAMVAMTMVLLILAGAAPLSSSANKQLAQSQFNSDVQSLSDALIAVSTNPALCQPTAGQTWVLPQNRNKKWKSMFNGNVIATTSGVHPISVVVQTPFLAPNNKNYLLVPQTAAGGMPPNNTIPNVAGTQKTDTWSYLPGASGLNITALQFVPTPAINGFNPVTLNNGVYSVEGTLQFAAESNIAGVVANSMRTVASMIVQMDSNGNPLGCIVDQSEQVTCEQYGGMWNASLTPPCRFGYSLNCAGSTEAGACVCPAGEYVKQLNPDGTGTCAAIDFECPGNNPALPVSATNPEQAFVAIVNGQVDCAPISPQPVSYVQFKVANETVSQGSGDPSIEIDLSAPQQYPVTVQVAFSGGTAGTDYSAPGANPFTVTFPANVTQEFIGQGFSVLSSGNSNAVNVGFSLSNPQLNGGSTSILGLGAQNVNTLVISAAAAANCPAQPMTWNASGNSCTGNIAQTASGSSATATDPSGNSATYLCTNGVWGSATGATCAPSGGSCASWDYECEDASGNPEAGGPQPASGVCSSTGMWQGGSMNPCMTFPWTNPTCVCATGANFVLTPAGSTRCHAASGPGGGAGGVVCGSAPSGYALPGACTAGYGCTYLFLAMSPSTGTGTASVSPAAWIWAKNGSAPLSVATTVNSTTSYIVLEFDNSTGPGSYVWGTNVTVTINGTPQTFPIGSCGNPLQCP